MMIEMRLRYAKPKRPAVTQCRDTAAMNDPKTKNALAADFKVMKMNNYNDFVTSAETVLEKRLAKVEPVKRRTPWLDEDIIESREDLKTARETHRGQFTRESKEQIAVAAKNLAQPYVTKQSEYYNRIAEEVENVSIENKVAAAFKAVDLLTGRKARIPCGIAGNSPEERTAKL